MLLLSLGITSRRRLRRIAVWALIAIAAAVGIYLGAGGTRLGILSSRRASGPIIVGPFSIPSDALDFGTVWAQRDFKWTVPITNVSDRSVDVTDVIPQCGCAVTDRSPFSVAPGQTAEIKLSIDLTSKRLPVEGQVERFFPVGVMLLAKTEHSNDVRLNVQGIVKDPLYLLPPAAIFADVWEDAEELPVAHLAAMPLVPLEKLTATSDEELKVVVGTGEYRQNVRGGRAERGFPIDVALNKRLPCGEHALNMTLFATTSAGQELPGWRVTVKVVVVGDVFMSPAFSHLGPVPLGSEEKSSFQLVSRRGLPFRVTNVEVPDSDGFRVTLDAEAAQPLHRLNVAYSVSERGERSIPVTIDWEAEGEESADSASGRSGTLKLKFTYVGLP